ncbi:MAG TPA: hypothetical protein VD931_06500 [Baekduia sp.]|nr:hypothetical protein [Baekduia sp.]
MDGLLVIDVPRAIPSGNDFHKRHWSGYAKEKGVWMVLIRRATARRANPPDVAMRARIITYRPRALDHGNLVAGAKPIPDVLIALNYLRDDSPAWFDCDYRQVIVPHGNRTVIQLWRRPPD